MNRTLALAGLALAVGVTAYGLPAPPDPADRAAIFGKAHIAAQLRAARGAEDGDRGYDVEHYDLTIDVLDGSIAGTVVVDARAQGGPLDAVVLDLHDELSIGTITSSHGVGAVTRADDFITIPFTSPVADEETFTVTVSYDGVPPSVGGPITTDPFNFDTHGPDDADIIFTLSVPWRSGAWWPCKEELSDRATIDVHVTVADTLVAASNGTLVGIDELGNGRHTYNWSHGYPISPYLVSLSISNYVVLTDSVDITLPGRGGVTVPLEYYVYPEKEAAALTDFSRFPQAMQHLSDLYGLYPFSTEKYGMALIEWSGGMEHQTCSSIGNRFVRGDMFYEWVFVHELAHQWFGDRITLGDWRDVWLNEGFATYTEALWAEYVARLECEEACPDGEDCTDSCTAEAHDTYRLYMDGLDPFPPPAGGGFFGPIYDPSPLYGAAPYNKGGWVLHMLRGVVGDSLLFGTDPAATTPEGRGILKEYVARFSGENVSTSSFVDVVKEIAATPTGLGDAFFDTFFDQWITVPSRPSYRVEWNYAEAGGGYDVVVNIRQTQTHRDVYVMPLQVEIALAGGGTSRATVMDDARDRSFTLHVDARPVGVTLDPDLWVLRNDPIEVNVAPVAVPALARNPARATARISYLLTSPSDVSLRLFDAAGRRVRTLIAGPEPAGRRTLTWDGTDESGKRLGAGVYFVELETPAGRRTTRLVYLR